jgi:hypothetical protein
MLLYCVLLPWCDRLCDCDREGEVWGFQASFIPVSACVVPFQWINISPVCDNDLNGFVLTEEFHFEFNLDKNVLKIWSLHISKKTFLIFHFSHATANLKYGAGGEEGTI